MTQHAWLAPCACIGFAVLALLRAPPRAPVETQSRIVLDAAGTPVPIATPYRGTILTSCVWEYLETTHLPETLVYFGADRDRFARSLMGWIYPELSTKDNLWGDLFPYAHGPYAAFERVLALDAGAYLGGCGVYGLVPALQYIGLPALSVDGPHDKNWDEHLFTMVRTEARLVEHPERAEALINNYKKAYADLDRELQPSELTNRPRILIMGSSLHNWGHFYVKALRNDYQIYLPPAGVVNASEGWAGEQQDAERILAMDPDFIFEMGNGETLRDFETDPRWRGLKALRDKRIYIMPGLNNSGGGLAGLILQPLWVRWMAELTHPDKLQPKLRQVMRERLMSEFGYPLSDEQIDLFLRFDANSDSAGYAHFKRNALASNAADPAP